VSRRGVAVSEAPLASAALPDGPTLRSLELQSRHCGSGVGSAELIGTWRVWQIWDKKNQQPSRASAALRALAGTLVIQRGSEAELSLINSISFGALKLCFSGPGQLRQRRPLLMFQFIKMQLLVAGQALLTLSLPLPAKGKQPFFALIATGQSATGLAWLAARGRGGGLALWVREDKGG
jgi:hypothetical protein